MSLEAVSSAALTALAILISMLLVPNALLASGAASLRLWSSLHAPRHKWPAFRRPVRRPAASAHHQMPLISVHVPCHDEPAHIVIATLDALAQLTYPQFEVIVIDNNTPDPATWLPVAQHARKLGSRFRFFHEDGVTGAKAGALNLALGLTNPQASHIAVVDADYLVEPDFLDIAMNIIATDGVSYVQFPQAYRHGTSAAPIARELDDYFQSSAAAANHTRSMLLTGTLCVLSLEALRRVGGWPTGTITEDADLGLSLYASGETGLFSDRIVGRGLLPMDFQGLALQRDRWVAGNMQTLLRASGQFWRAVRKRDLPRGYVSILAQLTAWPAFLALPSLALLAAAMVRLTGTGDGSWEFVEGLSAATLLVSALALMIEQAIVRRRPDTMAVKLALLWTASLAWLPLFWGQRLTFRRTPKTASAAAHLPSTLVWGCLILAAAALILAVTGAPIAAVSLLFPILALPAAIWVEKRLAMKEPNLSKGKLPCTA